MRSADNTASDTADGRAADPAADPAAVDAGATVHVPTPRPPETPTAGEGVGVSVVILTMDEEVNLGGCLDSCGWCDDVHVLDSGSTDGTVAIAEARGVPVHVNRFESFAKQRNWATDRIGVKHDWVFHLDADERFTPELVAELRERIGDGTPGGGAGPADELDGFRCPHKMMLMGTWLRRSEGYPVYQVRLFHRGRLRFIDHGHGQREPADARLGTLREPYLHEAYRRGVFDWVARHNVHSQKEAEAIVFGNGAAARWRDLVSGDATRRRRAVKALSWRLPGRPWLRWLWILFLQRGFLDGPAAWRYADLMRLYDQMTAVKVRMLRARDRPRR